MPKTVRFCILCGRDIGDAYFCTNAECGRLPNFYRDVAAPERREVPQDRPPPPDWSDLPMSGEVSPRVPTVAVPSPADEEDRHTMALGPSPIGSMVDSSGKEQPLHPGSNEIGARKPAKIVIDRPQVSSRHAAIICEQEPGGGWRATVVDHSSTNGTFVNGEKVQSPRHLRNGDRIRFANVEFEVRLPPEDAARLTMQIPPG